MSNVMMACGHAANAKKEPEGTPVCAICYLIDPNSEVIVEAPDLTGREAECNYDKRRAPSSTSLAFFEHRPDQPTDAYYCGCVGWD